MISLVGFSYQPQKYFTHMKSIKIKITEYEKIMIIFNKENKFELIIYFVTDKVLHFNGRCK